MISKIQVQILNADLANQIKAAVDSLEASSDEEKVLVLELNSTTGDIPIAYEILNKIYASQVDLRTICSGTLSTAGTLLAFAGKPGLRRAELSTQFILNDQDPKPGSFRKINNANAAIISHILGFLPVRKREAKEYLSTRNVISSVEAATGRMIDEIDSFQGKYSLSKKKHDEKVKDEKVKDELHS